jgi:hypothetical protein
VRITVLGYKTRTRVLEPSLNNLLTVLHTFYTAMSSSVPLSPFSALVYSKEFINGTPSLSPVVVPKPLGELVQTRRFRTKRDDFISRKDARISRTTPMGLRYPSNKEVRSRGIIV